MDRNNANHVGSEDLLIRMGWKCGPQTMQVSDTPSDDAFAVQ